MWKWIGGFATASAVVFHAMAAEITATEARWLQGAWPVIVFARDAGLPLDIVVQPQPTPGAAPLALAYLDGRCKLVLSMRGNPEAQATLQRIAPDLLDATLELMAAHELGHCRRWVDGAWYGVPAGFSAGVPDGLSAELRAAWAGMSAARREEGYGDLVGLAWTQRRHPQHYARLYRWLVEQRSHHTPRGSHHDTLAWIEAAADPQRLRTAAASIFEASASLWAEVLARNAGSD